MGRKKSKKRENKEAKQLRNLLAKKQIVMKWMNENGIISSDDDKENILASYQKLGLRNTTSKFHLTALHSKYSRIMLAAGLMTPSAKKKEVLVAKDKVSVFYRSYDWRKIRYQVLKRGGAHCALCNSDRSDGIKLHVDHIKPLRKNWELRLDINNLQVLCEVCNHGKGNWDETDWRPTEELEIEDEWKENGKNPL